MDQSDSDLVSANQSECQSSEDELGIVAKKRTKHKKCTLNPTEELVSSDDDTENDGLNFQQEVSTKVKKVEEKVKIEQPPGNFHNYEPRFIRSIRLEKTIKKGRDERT